MGQGIYIHVPFCLSKCRYCAFNSRPVLDGVPEYYIRALLSDIEREIGRWGDRGEFSSVFLGGGTPSLLSVDQMRELMGALRMHFGISPEAEISMECNPNTVDRDRLSAYRRLGINRISLGIQSLSDSELRFLGRGHSRVGAVKALEIAHSVYGASLSADLIVGVPGQTPHSLTRSLETVADHVSHMSVYLLSVEPGTALDGIVRTGEVEMPGDEDMVRLYGVACAALGSAGFDRYEISNWCKPGSECVHNTVYWRRGDYLGLGAGAHSHIGGLRYAKACDPEEYARRLAGGEDGVVMREQLDVFQMFIEDLMLGLRMDRGVDPVRTAAEYGVDPCEVLGRVDDLLEGGYVSKIGNHILLSAKGVMLHDAIVEELVSAAHLA